MQRNRGRDGRNHFRDNNPRKKPFRFSPPGLSKFSEPEGYLRSASSAENLGSRFLVSFPFFGILIMEEITLQPVACDKECERGVGICETSGVGGSMGTRDGDGAVDGRLRMGRMNFGVFLRSSFLSGVWAIP